MSDKQKPLDGENEFPEIIDDGNAFGMAVVKKEEVSEEIPDETPKETPKPDDMPKEEETPKETPKEEPKPDETQKEDPLLKQLKDASPEFAQLCEKKGIKDLKTAVKLYQDQEASFTQKSQTISDYRKNMEPYYTFDESGKITGLTELGQKLKASQDAPQPAVQEKPVDPQELQQKFWEKFEADPLNTLVSIVQAVAQNNNPSADFDKKLEALRGDLKPYFDQQQAQKAQAIVNEVINENISSGDDKAKEFFEKYDPEIQAELNKIPPEFVKANPKLAISQAYKVVKAQKIQDFQNQLLKKQSDEQAKQVQSTETGTGSNAPVEPNVDPDIKSMQDALDSRPEGAFFV